MSTRRSGVEEWLVQDDIVQWSEHHGENMCWVTKYSVLCHFAL